MGGCVSSPAEEMTELLEASSSGEFDRFCTHFTADSCAVLRGLRGVEGAENAFFDLPKSGGDVPRILKVEEKDGAGFHRTDQGTLQRTDLAIVFVELRGDVVPFPMIRERGRWRIDLFTLKTQWSMLGRLGTLPDAAFSLPN